MRAALALFRRDLLLALRSPGDALTPVTFFALGAVLFPLGVGPAPERLAAVAAGAAWVLALFAALAAVDRAFQDDAEDGSLDLLLGSGVLVEAAFLARAGALTLIVALPLTPAAVVGALALGLAPAAAGVLALALAIGLPGLTLFAAMGAALTVGARRRGVLIGLLAAPLMAPILIFGAGAVEAAASGLSPRPWLLLLGACSAFAAPVCGFSGGAALRAAVK